MSKWTNTVAVTWWKTQITFNLLTHGLPNSSRNGGNKEIEINCKGREIFLLWGNTVKRWITFPREAVKSPSMEIFWFLANEALSNLLQLDLLWAGAWTRRPPEVPSNPFEFFYDLVLFPSIVAYATDQLKLPISCLANRNHIFITTTCMYFFRQRFLSQYFTV